MNLQEWQLKLEALDPSRIELGLKRVKQVFQRLSPGIRSEIILVGGTNGKGSAVAALEALLLAQGLTVGAYTSPHLQRFNERVRYQGEPVPDDGLVKAFERVAAVQQDTDLTYFEFTTLGAIELLAEKKPDYMIFEVGLGGRLDAVNILDADIAIVTGVALDHTDWLGSDLESIGYEKAGIYRTGKPAVYASRFPPKRLLKYIEDIGAIAVLRDQHMDIQEMSGVTGFSINTANSEPENICVPSCNLPAESVLAALSAYILLGFELSPELVKVISSIELPGRYQRLQLGDTGCVLDVAHNPQAAELLAQKLNAEDIKGGIAAIVGLMSDKPIKDILEPMVDIVENWYLVQPDIPRAASLDQISSSLKELGVSADRVQPVGRVKHMEPILVNLSTAVVFGSFYTVGEFLDYFAAR